MLKLILLVCICFSINTVCSQTVFEEIISVSAKRQKVFWESSGYTLISVDSTKRSESYTQVLDSQFVELIVFYNDDYSELRSIVFYLDFVKSYQKFLNLAERELIEGEKKDNSRIFVFKNRTGWVYFSEPIIENKKKYFILVVKQNL